MTRCQPAFRIFLMCMTCSAAPWMRAYAGDELAREPVFDVPFLEHVVVDGDPGDWGDRGFRINTMADEKGQFRPPSDFDPQIRIAWNEEGLCVLASVRDDAVVAEKNIRRMFEADSMEFFVGTKRGEHNYYMYIVGPSETSSWDTPRRFFFDERDGGPLAGASLGSLAASLATRQMDDGYCIETLLPWSNLGIEAKKGLTLAFQVYAMDGDPGKSSFRVAWFPAFDTHQNLTTSMYTLRLSDRPSLPVDTAIGGTFRDVIVVGNHSMEGRMVQVQRDGQELGVEPLKALDGRTAATIRVPAPAAEEPIGRLEVWIDDLRVGTTTRGSAASMLSTAMELGKLGFYQYVFSGTTFPTVEFRNSRVVRELVGKTKVLARFFNHEGLEVTQADAPGWYAGVVEVHPEHGRITRRFFSLFRTTDSDRVRRLAVPMEAFESVGQLQVEGGRTIRLPSMEELNEATAVRKAWEFHRTPGEAQAEWIESTEEAREYADKQRWITVQRKLYGFEQPPVIPAPIALPKPQAAPVLRDGTAAEAGIREAAIGEMEALMSEWGQSNQGQGVSICVARNGVVFFHRAMGNTTDGSPMTINTPCRLTSLTKTFTAALLLAYVDRGFVQLDASVESYLPPFRGLSVPVHMTPRMLVSHTSGLNGHYGDELRDLQERIADIYPTLTVPVEFIYNGVGYALCTDMLELLSEEPAVSLYQKILLSPLGMSRTHVGNSHNGAISTSGDLAILAQMYLNGGSYGESQIIGSQTMTSALPRQRESVQRAHSGNIGGVGLWTPVDDWVNGSRAYWHYSANSSAIWVEPDIQLVIAIASQEGINAFQPDRRKNLVRIIRSHLDATEESVNRN